MHCSQLSGTLEQGSATCRCSAAISASLIETVCRRVALVCISTAWGRCRRSASWCRWPISSSSFSRRCGLISGFRPSPASSRRPQLFCHGDVLSSRRQQSRDPPPDLAYHVVRSIVILVCGMLAGAVGLQLRRQFEASILAATARDRITNLFGQHVSPQVVERLMAEGTAPTAISAASPSCLSISAVLPPAPAPARRKRWWIGSTALSRTGRHPRSPWRHREQVPRRRLPGAVRRAARCAGRRASRGSRGARNARGQRTRQQADRAGRCGSVSAFTSARSSPAISARRGARNTL